MFGGASLDEPVQEGQGAKINGSVMLAKAESQEEVFERLKQDPYWTTGVWDTEKVSVQLRQVFVAKVLLCEHGRQATDRGVQQIQVFPFRSAIRQAL